MRESPRPEDVGDERTPVATEDEMMPDDRGAADPRSEPGLTGSEARFPYWLIIGAVVIIALVAIYLAWQYLSPH